MASRLYLMPDFWCVLVRGITDLPPYPQPRRRYKTPSGVITWSLDGNGAKLDIKEITISDDETSGEVWYTLPETKEVVRIPLDGSMLW